MVRHHVAHLRLIGWQTKVYCLKTRIQCILFVVQREEQSKQEYIHTPMELHQTHMKSGVVFMNWKIALNFCLDDYRQQVMA